MNHESRPDAICAFRKELLGHHFIFGSFYLEGYRSEYRQLGTEANGQFRSKIRSVGTNK